MRPTRPTIFALAAAASLGFATACAHDAPTAPQSSVVDAAYDRATDPAANSTAAARWNVVARQIVGRRELFGPLGIARNFALVGVAEYDAIVAAVGARPGPHELAKHQPWQRPSAAGAAAGAAAAVLGALYPTEHAVIDSQLAADAAQPAPKHESFAAGVAIGQGIAARVLARAAADRTTLPFTGTIPVGPGFWRNAPPPAQPLAPRWGEARPWLLTSGDQFRPAPPPAFGTPEFTAALAEVRTLSDTRTPAQLAIAQFWGVTALGGPLGYWTGMALDLAAAHHYGERRTARLLAVMHMATMDASIGCWDGKYAYWYIRPFQADPAITTPVGRPNFPSYPSAHSCISAAAAGVIAGYFPEVASSVETSVLEAGDARIYAGLHYRFDVTAGQALGASVARLALKRAPRHGEEIPIE